MVWKHQQHMHLATELTVTLCHSQCKLSLCIVCVMCAVAEHLLLVAANRRMALVG